MTEVKSGLDAASRAPRAGKPKAEWLDVFKRWDFAIALALVLTVGIGTATVSGFGGVFNADFRLIEIAPVLIMALPMTLVIVSGEIDLSIASMLGLSSTLMGKLWSAHVPLPLVVILCVVIGGVLGAFNGLLITVFKLPALAVTIGTLALYRGLAYVVLGGGAVSNFPSSWTKFVRKSVGGIHVPYVTVLALILLIGFAVILHATSAGRAIFAMGANAEAAVFSGIAVSRTKFLLFVGNGVVCGGAGVLYTLRYGSAEANNGTGLELVVITGVLLGGVSIFGGVGSVFGVVCAVLLLESVQSLLQLAGVNTSEVIGITGLLLIISVLAPNCLAMIRGAVSRRRAKAGELRIPIDV